MAMIDFVNKLSLEVKQAEQERANISKRLDVVEDYINDIMKNVAQLWIKSNSWSLENIKVRVVIL